MQLLHAAIATVGIYVFARFAPFSRVQRVLFAFGYFPLFEYGVISREYVLGAVLLFAFCAAYARRANLVVLALIAAMLGQTSAYGLMLSLALAATALVARVLPSGMDGYAMRRRDRPAAGIAAFAIVFGSAALCVLQLMPPADSGTVVGWQFNNPLTSFPLSIVWRALIPVPPIDPEFWNRNVMGTNKRVGPLALLLFFAIVWMLRKHRLALLLFAVGSLGLLTFGFVKFYGSIRHHGHIYLLLIAALWIGAAQPWRERGSDRAVADAEPRGLGKGLHIAFTGLLVVHVIAALVAVSIDWLRPFSQSKATAQFIRDNELTATFLIGERDTCTAPIAAYLNRKLYFPRGDRVGSFIVYDQRRLIPLSGDLVDLCSAKARDLGSDVVLISTSPLKDNPPGVRRIGAFQGSIVGDESFFLYRIPPWP